MNRSKLRRQITWEAARLMYNRQESEYYRAKMKAARLIGQGWVRPAENRPEDVPLERGDWFRLMWLSNRDFCRLMECCLLAPDSLRFAILHGMSRNTGMRWDIEATRQLVGYEPKDDVTRP